MKRIVDTNVAVVANGRNTHADEKCQLACINELMKIKEKGVIYIDENGFILDEYGKNLNHSGSPGVGDYFYQYVFNNQGNTEKCVKVSITPNDNSFEEFPSNSELSGFDPDDRKFVAVAVAAKKKPTILNAVDTRSWPIYGAILTTEKIKVKELCPCYTARNVR